MKKGFFPKGGGEVNLYIEPVKQIKPIHRVDVGEVCNKKSYYEGGYFILHIAKF